MCCFSVVLQVNEMAFFAEIWCLIFKPLVPELLVVLTVENANYSFVKNISKMEFFWERFSTAWCDKTIPADVEVCPWEWAASE